MVQYGCGELKAKTVAIYNEIVLMMIGVREMREKMSGDDKSTQREIISVPRQEKLVRDYIKLVKLGWHKEVILPTLNIFLVYLRFFLLICALH